MGIVRLLLALSVVVAHSSPLFGQTLWGGAIAVELFFIISGFYMALILNEKYNTPDKTMIFYKNRFLKLFPIYWTTLLLTILFLLATYVLFNKGGTIELLFNNLSNLGFFSFYILFSNIFILGEDIFMFLGLNGDAIIFTKYFTETTTPLHKFIIIPQSWTLSLEIMFYIIAPFIARKSSKLLITLFLASVIIKVSLWSNGYINDPWSYRFILSELSFFFIGMIIYRVYKLGFYFKIINNKSLFNVGFFIFLLSGYVYSDMKNVLTFNNIDSLKYLIYCLFILFLPLLFEHTKNNKIDRYIGELSYPVYIVHIFVLYFVNKLDVGIYTSLVAIIGSILLSITLNKYIQRNIEKIRKNNIKKVQNDK